MKRVKNIQPSENPWNDLYDCVMKDFFILELLTWWGRGSSLTTEHSVLLQRLKQVIAHLLCPFFMPTFWRFRNGSAEIGHNRR